MLRLTLKNILANKIRFALTTFGVILAVSFIVSSFVLGDGLRSTFETLSDEITAGVDLEVRPTSEFGEPDPLPLDLVSVVASVDGVLDAEPGIEGYENSVQLYTPEGELLPTEGPPQLAYNWSDNEELSPFSLVEGSAPELNEFVLDLTAAAENDFVIGETYELITPSGMKSLTLSGTSTFGANNDTLGAVLMQMNTAQAGELFGIDGTSVINVQLQEGVDAAAVQQAVQTAVSGSVSSALVVDHETVAAESAKDFTGEIDIVGNILLGFGFIALFVSIFIIYNTFAIVLGQRIKELALLRTIGADAKQIRRSVMGEALAIGIIASIGGILGGVAVAKGLEALMNATIGSLPESPTIIATRTIVFAVVVGVGVTLLSAIGPARRAAKVPAIAALRGAADDIAPGSRTRKIAGFGLLIAGLSAGLLGLAGAGSTSATIALMAFGAIAIFVGVTTLAPMTVGAITLTIGFPMALLTRVVGRLAQQNAARNPRRTATTAAALMIGIALVTTAFVVGQSIKQNFGTTMSESITADYIITDQLEDVDLPFELPAEILANEAFDAAAGVQYVEARVDGKVTEVLAVDFAQVAAVLNLDVQEGSYDTSVVSPVLISADEAKTTGYGIGDSIQTEFANGNSTVATITGVFYDESIVESPYLFASSVFDNAEVLTGPEWLAFSVADDATPAVVEAVIAELTLSLPAADVETDDEFVDRVGGMIDGMLAIVNVMIALAVIIALIGIANTLALSVFERTRELGLMRAIGMTRRQLRRMVRFEAALISTFGAVLGVAIGLLFGWGVVTALPAGYANLVIPTNSLIVLVAVAAIAGVIAAMLPARRAARMNVLDAISH